GGPTDLDPRAASVGPAQLAEAVAQRREPGLALRVALDVIHDHADGPQPVARGGPRRGRPRRRHSRKREKVPPPHSITSSARWMNDSGIVSPSAFAVLRLTIISNLIGSWIGKLAGLSPFKMRST